jgi:hypothetical protein
LEGQQTRERGQVPTIRKASVSSYLRILKDVMIRTYGLLEILIIESVNLELNILIHLPRQLTKEKHLLQQDILTATKSLPIKSIPLFTSSSVITQFTLTLYTTSAALQLLRGLSWLKKGPFTMGYFSVNQNELQVFFLVSALDKSLSPIPSAPYKGTDLAYLQYPPIHICQIFEAGFKTPVFRS